MRERIEIEYVRRLRVNLRVLFLETCRGREIYLIEDRRIQPEGLHNTHIYIQIYALKPWRF